MAEPITVEPGAALGELLFRDGKDHPQRSACPGCGTDLLRVGLVNLAYVFTSCDCAAADYTHLYEQLWHGACLTPASFDDLEPEALARAAHLDRPPLRGQWRPWEAMSVARRQDWQEWAERILTRVRSGEERADG